MLIKCEQGSEEWFKARANRLTASNFGSAAGIVGSYDSRPALYKLMMGLTSKKDNGRMSFGTDYEDTARRDGEIVLGHLSWPVGIYVHDDLTWLGASPDGFFLDNGLHEIKCRPENPYTEISQQHMAQIQGQLACSKCRVLHFQSWTPEKQRIWRVEFSREYWEWLLVHLKEFYQYLKTKEQPPVLRKKRSYEGTPLKSELIFDGDSYVI